MWVRCGCEAAMRFTPFAPPHRPRMPTIRAAIYARVSKPGQAKEDKISISDQLRECKKFIEKEGWQSVAEFVDPGVTSSPLDRPGLQALLAALGQFDVVVAWDFDRDRKSV